MANLAAALDPVDRMLVAAAPVCMLTEKVMAEMQAGRPHDAGVFVQSGTVLTADGRPTEYRLQAIAVPAEVLLDLVRAFHAVRQTEVGATLREQILAVQRPANQTPA